MKAHVFRTSILILAFVVGAPMASAFVETFGDFVVTEAAIDTGIVLFDTLANPPPFPNPSAIQQANTYPASGAGNITVAQIQAFLDGEGLPNDTFGICLELGPEGKVGIASLVITIDGQAAAISDGVLIIESFEPVNSVTYFIPQLNLDCHGASDKVLISYDTFTSVEDIVKINLAATPEPVSLLFLGTGLIATVLMRVKRKKH